MRLALVSCVKSKLAEPAAARDLYSSQLFQGMRRYAESHADRWLILSAEHGLVPPTKVIAPYERTLNRMRSAERRTWAEGVLAALASELAPGDTVIVLAGARYREHLVAALRARGITVEVPMAGLSFGRQLRWLGQDHGG